MGPTRHLGKKKDGHYVTEIECDVNTISWQREISQSIMDCLHGTLTVEGKSTIKAYRKVTDLLMAALSAWDSLTILET